MNAILVNGCVCLFCIYAANEVRKAELWFPFWLNVALAALNSIVVGVNIAKLL